LALDEPRQRMLRASDYEPHLPAVTSNITKTKGIMRKANVEKGFEKVDCSPFASAVGAFVQTCERDCEKALNKVGERYDEDFVTQIQRCEAVAGGAPAGRQWYDTFDEGGAVDLAKHFEHTLDKINAEQVCDCVSQLTLAMEPYALHRPESSTKDVVLARACKAVLACRVSQLYMVLFRTAKKSRKPEVRLQTCLSNFETEDHLVGRISAYDAVCPLVRAWLQSQFGLLPAPTSGDAGDAVPGASAGA
jgi:hypothetical protein